MKWREAWFKEGQSHSGERRQRSDFFDTVMHWQLAWPGASAFKRTVYSL